jgi:hypothetical protein
LHETKSATHKYQIKYCNAHLEVEMEKCFLR